MHAHRVRVQQFHILDLLCQLAALGCELSIGICDPEISGRGPHIAVESVQKYPAKVYSRSPAT